MSNENALPNENQYTREGALAGLMSTSVPMKVVGVEFIETTDNLAGKITDMIETSYGIGEIDHCFIYPIKDNEGTVRDFDVKLYFNTDKPLAKRHLVRIGSENDNGNKQDNRNTVDLMSMFVTTKGVKGAFKPTSDFRRVVTSFAKMKDGQLEILEEEHNKNIAVITGNFFKLMGLLLNVKTNDCYNFVVADCTPTTNRDDCLNFRLVIVKEIMPEDRRRNSRSGINYDALDRNTFNRNNRYNSKRYR